MHIYSGAPEPSYLLFPRAGSGVEASKYHSYVCPRGAELTGIYRHHHNHRHDLQGRIVPRRGNGHHDYHYCPPAWPGMMLARAAGPWAHICGLASDVLFWRYAGSRVAGRGVWPVAGR